MNKNCVKNQTFRTTPSTEAYDLMRGKKKEEGAAEDTQQERERETLSVCVCVCVAYNVLLLGPFSCPVANRQNRTRQSR